MEKNSIHNVELWQKAEGVVNPIHTRLLTLPFKAAPQGVFVYALTNAASLNDSGNHGLSAVGQERYVVLVDARLHCVSEGVLLNKDSLHDFLIRHLINEGQGVTFEEWLFSAQGECLGARIALER